METWASDGGLIRQPPPARTRAKALKEGNPVTPARTLSLFLILVSLLAASSGPPPTEASPGPSQAPSRAEASTASMPAETTTEKTTSSPEETVEGTAEENTSAPEETVEKTAKKEPGPKQEPADKIVEVAIRGLLYVPGSVTVSPGTTVRWVNEDRALHTVTSEGSGGPLASEELGRGDTYEYTFREPGQYDYYCVVHPFMKSGITVA
jgi:plastocyanin